MNKFAKLWESVKRHFWTTWFEYRYRRYDDNTCCCGEDMDRHSSPLYCGHTPTSKHGWIIHCAVAEKMGEKP